MGLSKLETWDFECPGFLNKLFRNENIKKII